MVHILDIFQKGLIRGAERLPFDPEKEYAYVEHPTEKWRVYLRSCIFLHPTDIPFDSQHFLVVKRRGSKPSGLSWEPPKGQMEGKDFVGHRMPMIQVLKQNALRETAEEAHITEVKRVKHMGLVFQSQEVGYPVNHYFQYHIFQGFITPEQIKQSFDMFQWIREHPKGFARWKRDRKEKDAVAWFDPKMTRLNPRWCPDIVMLYLRSQK